MYTLYNPSTGQILSTVSGSGESLAHMLSNQHYIEGSFNNQYYIDLTNLQAIDKGVPPSLNYEWDYNSKEWILNSEQAVNYVRTQRDLLLSVVDKINPVWYNSLTQEQQTELGTYRQQLLDVPQQSGFPMTIEWPTKPTWL